METASYIRGREENERECQPAQGQIFSALHWIVVWLQLSDGPPSFGLRCR